MDPQRNCHQEILKNFQVIFQQLSLLAINITQIIIVAAHLRDITEIGMLCNKIYVNRHPSSFFSND
jgi:hypothetical protein